MILRAHIRLYALPVPCPPFINSLPGTITTYETDRADGRMVAYSIHSGHAAVYYVEDSCWETGFSCDPITQTSLGGGRGGGEGRTQQ